MSKIKNAGTRFILFTIFATCCIMFVKKTNVIEKINNSINLRELALTEKLDYSCDKAGSRLMDKYQDGFTEDAGDSRENLNEAQQSIVDFARDRKYSNIKPYLKRVGIYIAFLCLAVIIISLWISYCSCCCCKCCLFKAVEGSSKLSFIFYLISAIFNLLVIVFSIVILCLTSPFFKRLNGLFCSTLTMLDHFTNGFGSHYPNYSSEWDGLNHINERFNESYEEFNAINLSMVNETYNEAIEKCEEEESECICNITEVIDTKISFDFFYFLNTLLVAIPAETLKINGAKTIINETTIDVGDDIYDFLHDYANRHIKNACIAIFVLTLIIGVLGLASLSLYYFLKSGIYRIIYMVIWNISMLFVILTIVVSVIFGVLGYIFRDAVQIGHYTLSSQNIKSDKPIVFTSKNEYLSDLIEECVNGNGYFISTFGEDTLNSQDELDDEFEEEISNIYNNTCNNDTRDALIQFYESIYNATTKINTITGNLYNIKCRFAKNDKNIILNELESAGKRATVLSTFQFLVGIFLAISVLAGIFLVHKYKHREQNTSINRDVTINQSSGQEGQINTTKSFEHFNDGNK